MFGYTFHSEHCNKLSLIQPFKVFPETNLSLQQIYDLTKGSIVGTKDICDLNAILHTGSSGEEVVICKEEVSDWGNTLTNRETPNLNPAFLSWQSGRETLGKQEEKVRGERVTLSKGPYRLDIALGHPLTKNE